MYQFLSEYNYDFALASVPIQIILLFFYASRRNLPIRQSVYYTWVMLFNLGMTVFDVLSCEMNEIWAFYPLWFMYLVNMAYFVCFIFRGWALYAYTLEACKAYMKLPAWLRYAPWAMAGFMLACILSTPWTGAIFRVDPVRGYYNCGIYNSIYVSTWFYIACSLAVIFLCRKLTAARLRIALYASNVILIAGILLRQMFIDTLVTSYFSILAVLTIYLSAQNPDIYLDQKSGVFNRYAFGEIIGAGIAKKKVFSCFAFSVTEYANLRSLYGREQMDRFTRMVGDWLQEEFPKVHAFSYGGGRYLLLCQGQQGKLRSHEQLDRVIRERFSRPWQNGNTEIVVSVVTVSLPEELPKRSVGFTEECLVRGIELALERGAGTYFPITESVIRNIDREDAVERALGRALAEDRLEVYFQPVCNMKTGRITAAEALARLHDPELGYIPPSEFIHAAEQDGTIMKVGAEIFRKTCRFIASNDMDALGIEYINVNLSPAQCLYEGLADELIGVAQELGVPMSRIGLEITETELDDISVLERQMKKLQEVGVRFALDDFGTGTSNLTRLLGLPLQTVKIDMTITWSYFKDGSRVLIHLLRMFADSDYKVVVEGVENRRMADELRTRGADYEQGYFYSAPLPPEQFVQYLCSVREDRTILDQ